jgi:hypothetical protein
MRPATPAGSDPDPDASVPGPGGDARVVPDPDANVPRPGPRRPRGPPDPDARVAPPPDPDARVAPPPDPDARVAPPPDPDAGVPPPPPDPDAGVPPPPVGVTARALPQSGPGSTLFRMHWFGGSHSADIDVWEAACDYSIAPNSACSALPICRGGIGCEVGVTDGGDALALEGGNQYLQIRFDVTGLFFERVTVYMEARGMNGPTDFEAWSPLYGPLVLGPVSERLRVPGRRVRLDRVPVAGGRPGSHRPAHHPGEWLAGPACAGAVPRVTRS